MTLAQASTGAQLVHGHDDVGGDAEAGGRFADGLGVGGLVEAVGLLLVGREERVDPPDADVVVDRLDPGVVQGVGLELLDEVAFDHVERRSSRGGPARALTGTVVVRLHHTEKASRPPSSGCAFFRAGRRSACLIVSPDYRKGSRRGHGDLDHRLHRCRGIDRVAGPAGRGGRRRAVPHPQQRSRRGRGRPPGPGGQDRRRRDHGRVRLGHRRGRAAVAMQQRVGDDRSAPCASGSAWRPAT